MNFSDVKRAAIKCLKEGAYDHDTRGDIDVKNLFSTGQVSEEHVIELIKKTSGDMYHCCRHHQDCDIDVHILNLIKIISDGM